MRTSGFDVFGRAGCGAGRPLIASTATVAYMHRNRTDQSDRTDRSDLMRPSGRTFLGVNTAGETVVNDLSCTKPRRLRRRVAACCVVGGLVCAWLAYEFLMSRSAEDRYRATVAEADRLDPGWREGTSPASSEMIPDDGNSAVLVMASYEKVPRGLAGGLKGQWPPLSLDPRAPLAPELLTELRLRRDEARDRLADARSSQTGRGVGFQTGGSKCRGRCRCRGDKSIWCVTCFTLTP